MRLLFTIFFMCLGVSSAKADRLIRFIPPLSSEYGTASEMSCMPVGPSSALCMVSTDVRGADYQNLMTILFSIREKDTSIYPRDGDEFPYAIFEVDEFEWFQQPTSIESAPECVARPGHGYNCFYKAYHDRKLYQWTFGFDGTEPVAISDTVEGDPECFSRDGKSLDCFMRNSNFQVIHAHLPLGGDWSDWELLPTSSPPGALNCLAATQAELHCFARGPDNGLWHIWGDTSNWSGWENLGGHIVGKPSCLMEEPNKLSCYARGGDSQMWNKYWAGDHWTDWESIGGRQGRILSYTMSGSPSCNQTLDELLCFAAGRQPFLDSGRNATAETMAIWARNRGDRYSWATLMAPQYVWPPSLYEVWYDNLPGTSPQVATVIADCAGIDGVSTSVCVILNTQTGEGQITHLLNRGRLEARSDVYDRVEGERLQGIQIIRTRDCAQSLPIGPAQCAACRRELEWENRQPTDSRFQLSGTLIEPRPYRGGLTQFSRNIRVWSQVSGSDQLGCFIENVGRYQYVEGGSESAVIGLKPGLWRLTFPGVTCDVQLPLNFAGLGESTVVTAFVSSRQCSTADGQLE